MDKIAERVVNSVTNANSLGIVCEKCGSYEITEISYGLPGWIVIDEPIDPKIQRLIDDRHIVLGGCIKTENSPKYYCRRCKARFGKVDS